MQVPYVCVCCGDVAKASSPFEINHYLYRINPAIMNNNLKNFDEIVSYAEKYSIKIAFENTEGEEYLLEQTKKASI